MKETATERLLLRHITENDAEDIYEYGREPNVGPNAGWKPHDSIEETRRIMSEVFIGKANVFGMVLKDSGKMIGSIGFMPDPKRNNTKSLLLGYAMSEKHWGRGLMTEAARCLISNASLELPINLISCTCYSFNDRSRRVMLKCGFEYEGCLRQCEQRYDGKIFDVECYSLLLKK
ncbi:MAG: GNAT family N-acetyltransferase [Bacteroidales bacterium]|jgi:putative acetyltransferase|nr:GNAT family N-acetyltransferase [Bacteroidales bacterium]